MSKILKSAPMALIKKANIEILYWKVSNLLFKNLKFSQKKKI